MRDEVLSKALVVFPERLLPVYRRRDVTFTAGSGAHLYDVNNKEYLDFASGIGVNILGYGHPALMDAMKSAIQNPWHVSNGYRASEAESLADKIHATYGFERSFFCNSGSEATEAIIKSIMAYNFGKRSKPEIIAFNGSFHGRCWGSMSVSCNSGGNYDVFGPLLNNVRFADKNIESVLSVFSENTGGIILEPVQGHAGCSSFSDETLQELRILCDKHDVLLCYDCIQAGYGRTGDFFAYERSGARPDIVAVAKGMAGGLPMGACFFDSKAAVLKVGQHGSTVGGNPLCAAIANVVWNEVHDLLPSMLHVSNSLNSVLNQLQKDYPSIIKDVKGRGLLRGVVLHNSITSMDMSLMLLNSGLITMPSDGNSLRLMPPYIIDHGHVTKFAEIFANVLRALSLTL